MDNSLVDVSEKSSNTGSGFLIDVDQLDFQEADKHSRKPSKSSSLSEDLIGLRLDSVAPAPHPTRKRNHGTLNSSGIKAGYEITQTSSRNLMDDDGSGRAENDDDDGDDDDDSDDIVRLIKLGGM